MAKHKYSLPVALGLVSADAAADAALLNWADKVGKIHAVAAEECANRMSISHLKCVLKGLIQQSANLIAQELGPETISMIQQYLRPLVQAKARVVQATIRAR